MKKQVKREITLKVTCNQLIVMRTALVTTLKKKVCPHWDVPKIEDVVKQIEAAMDNFSTDDMYAALGVMLDDMSEYMRNE